MAVLPGLQALSPRRHGANWPSGTGAVSGSKPGAAGPQIVVVSFSGSSSSASSAQRFVPMHFTTVFCTDFPLIITFLIDVLPVVVPSGQQ